MFYLTNSGLVSENHDINSAGSKFTYLAIKNCVRVPRGIMHAKFSPRATLVLHGKKYIKLIEYA